MNKSCKGRYFKRQSYCVQICQPNIPVIPTDTFLIQVCNLIRPYIINFGYSSFLNEATKEVRLFLNGQHPDFIKLGFQVMINQISKNNVPILLVYLS